MVRNKRAAPAAPSAAAPLVQTLPWTPGRQKGRAPLPPSPSAAPTMPTSVSEKAAGVLPPTAGQTSARFCLGPYERRGGGGATPDPTDGGSLGVDSEGSSTDVGVCLDDSASDVSQDSLVTSDSAVSSPPARRGGRRRPEAGPAGTAAPTQTTSTARAAGEKSAAEGCLSPQAVVVKEETAQTVAVGQTLLSGGSVGTRGPQVISINSEPIETAPVESTTLQVACTVSPAPQTLSVGLIDQIQSNKAPGEAVPADSARLQTAIEKMGTLLTDSSKPLPAESTAEQETPQNSFSASVPAKANSATEVQSLSASPPSSLGASSVFLSPEQPIQSQVATTQQPSAPSVSPSAAPPPSTSPEGGSTSVFLSPGQPEAEVSPSLTPCGAQSLPDSQSEAESQGTPVVQQPKKSPAPQPPKKSPAPPVPQGSSVSGPSPHSAEVRPPPKSPATPSQHRSTVSPSPLESRAPPSPRPAPTPASLRQLPAPSPPPPPPPPAVQTRTYAERQRRPQPNSTPLPPLPEHGLQFHLREAAPDAAQGVTADGFAGVRDYLSPTAPIHSSRGTVRGVKDRVRAGIATFLQDNAAAKTLKRREQGRLVVYVTTMSVVRPTYQQCQRVRQILRQLMAEFEERDLFLSEAHQHELRARLGDERVIPPQVFIDGNLLGGADAVERLNESGELRRMLRPFKVAGPRTSCARCGGFRMLPCTACNGSKKSCHRNHFTEQWVVLRCGLCDQSGLMHCDLCRS